VEISAEAQRGDLRLLWLSFSLTLLLDAIKVLVQFVEVLPTFRHYANSRVKLFLVSSDALSDLCHLLLFYNANRLELCDLGGSQSALCKVHRSNVCKSRVNTLVVRQRAIGVLYRAESLGSYSAIELRLSRLDDGVLGCMNHEA
jgi:hypothetical protein